MKKFMGLLLSVCLVLSLVACGASSNAPSTASSSTAPQNSTASAAPQDAPVSSEPLKFTILHDALAWTKNNIDPNTSEELKLWSELTNTEITYITPPHSEYDTKVSIIFASGDLPDVVTSGVSPETGGGLMEFIDGGSIIPLDAYFEQYGAPLDAIINEKDYAPYTISGERYAIPALLSLYNYYGIIMRKDWLDKLGLEPPETLEDYKTVLKAFKEQDPDGNGQNDTFGGTFRESFTWMNGFVGSFGVNSHNRITYDVVDGKLVPQQTQPKYKEYLEFMRELWSEGIFTPNSMVNTSDQWKKEIFTDIAGMWYHQNTRIDEYFMAQFALAQPDNNSIELIATVPPIGKDGLRGSPTDPSSTRGIAITTKAERPEEIFQYFVNTFTNPEWIEFSKYGIEGKHHTVVNGKKEWIPEALTDDSLLQVKEITFLESKFPIDDEEVIARYGQRAYDAFEQNQKYNLPQDTTFDGKPLLTAEKDYPDIDTVVLEYTVKIISGELPLEAFDDMVERLNKSGLQEVTADRQAWYDENKK